MRENIINQNCNHGTTVLYNTGKYRFLINEVSGEGIARTRLYFYLYLVDCVLTVFQTTL